MSQQTQRFRFNFFQKFLSSFLSFLFISSVLLFSFAAGVNAASITCDAAAGEVCEQLLFPLENEPVNAVNPNTGDVALNPTSLNDDGSLGVNDPEGNCKARGGTWDAAQEACSDSWLDDQNPLGEATTGWGANNAELIGGLVGGGVVMGAGYFAGSSGVLGTIAGGVLDAGNYINAAISNNLGGSLVSTQGGFLSAQGSATVNAGQIYGDPVSTVDLANNVSGTSAVDFGAGVNIDFGGAAIAGAISGLVVLALTGDIKQAAIAAVKSTVISIAAQAIAGYLITAINPATGVLLGMGPVGWAIVIGLVISMVLCPVVGVELPSGQFVAMSTFLVGKINKQMEGESWEKILLSDEQFQLLNGKLNLVVGEILPEILYLNKLSVFDLVWSGNEKGGWFIDQNGNPQFFYQNQSISWRNGAVDPEAVDWLSFWKKAVNTSEIEKERNREIEKSSSLENEIVGTQRAVFLQDPNVTFQEIQPGDVRFNLPSRSNIEAGNFKILIQGGIQQAYHQEKFRMLAKFRPVLLWFYQLADNTFVGNIVKREILEKEGFTLEVQNGEIWEKIHSWVTYGDQPRLLSLSSEFSGKTLRIVYESDYLTLENVSVQVSQNPQFSFTEIASETLPKSLFSIDDDYEVIQTGEMQKNLYLLPEISSSEKREIFMQTSGYYHPLADDEMIQEYQKQREWFDEWTQKVFW